MKGRTKTLISLIIAVVMISAIILGSWILIRKPETQISPTSTITSMPVFPSIIYPKVYGYEIFSPGIEEIEIHKISPPKYDLPVEFSSVENFEYVAEVLENYLDNKALELLRRNGFVVTDAHFDDIAELYKSLKENGVPIYISTDSVLFVYHAFFDTILMELETEKFYPMLSELTEKLVKETLQMYEQIPSNMNLTKDAVKLNLAYLCVAAKLLDPEFKTPSIVEGLVQKELALIQSANQHEYSSPIFGYNEDYTQYKPRGHYTQSEELQRYFKAMMWYGRMRFEANDPWYPELAIRQTAQALILTYLICTTKVGNETALNIWEKIYLPTVFIVGKSDDLTFYDYIEVMREVYGEFSPTDVENLEKLTEFQEKIVQRDRSRIRNVPWWPEEEIAKRLSGLRFMGQRFILDGYIHQELCYPRVEGRIMVKGFDIMAALGSERAEQYLEIDKSKYPGYSQQLEKMKQFIESLTIKNWTESLYNSWLYTIKAIVDQKFEGYPTFMTTEAWLDKCLFTGLASWAQLRHDTILYAKQPYAAKVSIPPQPPHPGYVEPMPIVYYRLALLANATKVGLEKLGLINEVMKEKLTALIDLLDNLTKISIKELKGEALSEQDRRLLLNYGGILEMLLKGLRPRSKDPRIIADVFTDPNGNAVLEVGTGYFHLIFVIYKTPDGKIYISVGGVMSYYEFKWPQTQRLTDEEWQSLLESGQIDLPEWVNSFHA